MISENLQKYRTEKGLSDRELGEKANVHFNTIKRIEKKINLYPSLTTVKKLAAALDVTINDLLK